MVSRGVPSIARTARASCGTVRSRPRDSSPAARWYTRAAVSTPHPERADDELDPLRVQAVMVGMLFDPEYAARVQGDAPLVELTARERSLLRAVDPRALRTDRYRRARAVATLVEEYPVTAVVVGTAVLDRFFATAAFRAAVLGRGSMALAFGAWLGERAHGVGRLEAAMAAVRRAEDVAPAELCCAPRLRALVVPAGTLAYHGRARERLGPDVAGAMARGDVRLAERPPQRGHEYLLVERRDDGSIDLGTGSGPLVRLLVFAAVPRTREALRAEAVRQGAEADEADEILDDLLAQGMLRSG